MRWQRNSDDVLVILGPKGEMRGAVYESAGKWLACTYRAHHPVRTLCETKKLAQAEVEEQLRLEDSEK